METTLDFGWVLIRVSQERRSCRNQLRAYWKELRLFDGRGTAGCGGAT
jgi:hypothetical protein